MGDPRRLFDAKDIQAAALYANQVSAGAEDFYPLKVDANGYLLISMTVGSVSLSSTASTITNAVGNPVNVALTSTKVTIESTGLNVTPTTTASTITNAAGNPVNVALTSTVVSVTLPVALSTTLVTIANGASNIINVNVATATLGTVTTSLSSTLVTVAPQAGSSFATTAVTITNGASNILSVNVATATLGTVTVSLSSTIVTTQVSPAASVSTVHFSPSASVVTVHISPSASAATVSFTNTRVTATLIAGQTAIDGNAGAVSAATIRTVESNNNGRTLTCSSGTISSTNATITFAPTNKIKVYAFSLTTTSATEVTCIFHTGTVGATLELWRVTLMAPAGTSAGANLSTQPPCSLFQSRSTSAVSLSLSSAVLVHYSISYYDEA